MSAMEKDEITIVAPNGARRTEKYRPHDTVGKTLEHAVKSFGKDGDLDPTKEYILVLGDTPLALEKTLAEAGVQPGATLKVRAKQIPGDGSAL
jgi:hypothetical protein